MWTIILILNFMRFGIVDQPNSVIANVENREKNENADKLNNTNSAELQHRDAVSRFAAAILKQKRNDLTKAKVLLEQAVQTEPTAAEPLRELFKIHVELGRYTSAIRTGKKVLQLDRNDYKTAMQLANILLDSKKAGEAVSMLETVSTSGPLSKDPANAVDFYQLLAKSADFANDYPKAIEAHKKRIRIFEQQSKEICVSNRWTSQEVAREHGLAIEAMGLQYVKAKNSTDAAKAFFEAEKIFRSTGPHPIGIARVQKNLAKAFAAVDDFANADIQYKKYLSQNIKDDEAIQEYFLFLVKNRKISEGVKSFQALNTKFADNRSVLWHYQLCLILNQDTNFAESIMFFEDQSKPKADRLLIESLVKTISTDEIYFWYNSIANRRSEENKQQQKQPKDEKHLGPVLRYLSDAIRDEEKTAKEFVNIALKYINRNEASQTLEFAGWLADRLGQARTAEIAIKATRLDNWDQAKHLVNLYERQFRWEEIKKLCERFASGKTRSLQAIFFLAIANAELGEYEIALTYVNQLAREESLFAEGKFAVRLQQCRILSAAKQSNKALLIAEKLFDDAANPAEIRKVRVALADCYFQLEDIVKAESQLRAILEEDPDDILALNNLGYNLAERGMKLAEAEVMIRQAIEQDRDDRIRSGNTSQDSGTYLDSLGWVLHKQNKNKEAKAVFEQAITMPDAIYNPVVLDHFGDVLFQLEEKEAAIVLWEKALERIPENLNGRLSKKRAEIKMKMNK